MVRLMPTTAAPSTCTDPMGLENGLIGDQQVAVSSLAPGVKGLRLGGPDAWSPAVNSRNEYVAVDLQEVRNLSGVVTQGHPTAERWVEAYTIRYSSDGQTWFNILNDEDGTQRVFPANVDSSTRHTNLFVRPVSARFLAVVPWQWHRHIALRLDILGCYLPVGEATPAAPTTLPPATSPTTLPGQKVETTTAGKVATFPTTLPGQKVETTTTGKVVATTPLGQLIVTTPAAAEEATTTTTTTVAPRILPPTPIPSHCKLCPNVPQDLMNVDSCACPPEKLWDGNQCVHPSQCSCYDGLVRYPVGTIRETDLCSVCVCKLGGVSECRAKTCPACAGDELLSVLSGPPHCKCQCQPCAEGTRLCPSSNACINSTLWCNGVEDCPDDERDCAATTTTGEESGILNFFCCCFLVLFFFMKSLSSDFFFLSGSHHCVSSG